jgi:hypothetical protein
MEKDELLGQLIAAKIEGQWVLGLVIGKNISDYYVIEWCDEPSSYLNTFRNRLAAHQVREYIQAYRGKVLNHMKRGTIRWKKH